MRATYVFRSQWRVLAAPTVVYRTLADVEGYPAWWPQIRGGRRIDAASGEVTCRSFLPYNLTFRVTREVEDPDALVLRAALSGDLCGFSQWTVRPAAGATIAVFEEDVEVGAPLLRYAGWVARPLLRLNHAHMMRSGELGLRRQLSSVTPARS